MKRVFVVIALLAFALGALPASAGQDAAVVVRHGEGIGKLRLGMTIPQVRRVLGPPDALNKNERRGNGYVYRELGWDLGWWTIGFMRAPGGKFKAVRIGTVSRAQRTPEGLGTDSKESDLYRKLPGLFCRGVFPSRGGLILHYECIYRRPTGRQTAFVLSQSRDPDDPPNTERVDVVEVRTLLFYRGWRVRFNPR